MQALSTEGRYEVTQQMREGLKLFRGGYATEEEVLDTIRRIFLSDGYVIDPHTAVGACVYDKYRKETGDDTPMILASTASPYKFGRSVLHAVDPGRYDGQTDDEQFESLHELSGVDIPQAITELLQAEVRHHMIVDPDGMREAVRSRILG